MLVAEVSRALRYEPSTGRLHWLEARGSRSAGAQAGCVSPNRYVRIRLNDKLYLAHRLAWVLFYGEIPSSQIDHVNGDPSDNRIANLRLSSPAENIANSKLHCDNSSGFKGVTFCKRTGRYMARLGGRRPRRNYIGMFDTAEAAHEAYIAAAKQHFGEFARTA